MNKMTGPAIRLKKSDNINTDYIISGRYKFRIQNPKELAKHLFEDLEPNFYSKSFARIFYRNAFNLGLPLIECNTDLIGEGDSLSLDLDKSALMDTTKKTSVRMKPVSKVMKILLKDGGVIKHFNKHGGFKL